MPNVSDAAKPKIMHAQLPITEAVHLMASDVVEGLSPPVTFGNNFHISVVASDKAEADRVFAALSSGGRVAMPLANAPWGPYFGMCAQARAYGIYCLRQALQFQRAGRRSYRTIHSSEGVIDSCPSRSILARHSGRQRLHDLQFAIRRVSRGRRPHAPRDRNRHEDPRSSCSCGSGSVRRYLRPPRSSGRTFESVSRIGTREVESTPPSRSCVSSHGSSGR